MRIRIRAVAAQQICICACVLWLARSAPPVAAQSRTPGIQAQSVDPAAQIVSMLRSSDARQQAWGAWFSGRDALRQTIPLLTEIVASRNDSVTLADRAAVDVALDALIEMKASVPADLLLRVHEQRPAQALALMGRSDGALDDALLALMRKEHGTSWFAAANLALARPALRLAPVLLEDLRITLTIFVSERGSVGGGTGVGGGSGCGTPGPAEGLPPWPSYALTSYAMPGVVVLAVGPTPMYYERRVSRAGDGPSGSVRHVAGPSATDRLKYVAAVLGADASSFPVGGDESHPVAWRGAAALDAEVARLRLDVATRYSALLSILVSAGALNQEEAESLAAPRITVTVRDVRGNRSVSLGDHHATR